jgi:hypothetical protein
MQRSNKASDGADDISGGNGGLLKKIITKGTGEQIPSNVVAIVHYTGKLLDGTVFDSSKKRGTPFTFNIGKREGRIMIVDIFAYYILCQFMFCVHTITYIGAKYIFLLQLY